MANKRYVVELSAEERARLGEMISKGKSSAKAILKARILLKADQGEAGEGWTDERICEALDTNVTMVARVRAKLVTEGLVTLEVVAFDWNCPKFITPRFTADEVRAATEPLRARIAELEAIVAATAAHS